MQLMTLTTKGQVTIPLGIRLSLGLKPGDRVLFEEVGETVEVKSAPTFFDYRGSLVGSMGINSKKIRNTVAKKLADRYLKSIK